MRVPPVGMRASARQDRKPLIIYVEDCRARALATQRVLPSNLACVEGLEEESLLNQIDSGLLMLLSAHNDTRRHVRESQELVANFEGLVSRAGKGEKARGGCPNSSFRA
ncbi:hypothetical protein JCGZ_14919 [Jatropha curcas]|uniref:Uncharacterized protein n=1 Tax=Jatropha curcas TaxID=180498 RepID=A0A067LC79_JATCU|nr:hypothetical protein JCGZ_14919 [Jatropha curcas]